MHVTAMRARYIGKETDRKWEHGDDFSLLAFKPAEFDDLGQIVKADAGLIERIRGVPIKSLVRMANVDRNTIRKVLRGASVRGSTIQRIVATLQ